MLAKEGLPVHEIDHVPSLHVQTNLRCKIFVFFQRGQ